MLDAVNSGKSAVFGVELPRTVLKRLRDVIRAHDIATDEAISMRSAQTILLGGLLQEADLQLIARRTIWQTLRRQLAKKLRLIPSKFSHLRRQIQALTGTDVDEWTWKQVEVLATDVIKTCTSLRFKLLDCSN